MHIQTRQRTTGGGHNGPAASDRGFFASIASVLSSVVGGASRPPAPTADADTGAGLRGSVNEAELPSLGDANSAPLEGDYTSTPSDPV